ncbi:MAG: hypothetical protein NVSMB30_02670 [Hymenobacter sp.]
MPAARAPGPVLVFGGTTEGRQVAAWLSQTDYAFWYSTKSRVEMELPANGQYRCGAFTEASLADFCRQQRVRGIVHASHPFAEQLHATIGQVSQQLTLPVGRVEREYPKRSIHPLVHYADSYEEVADRLLAGCYEPVLALSGVQTLARLQRYWLQRTMLCRVLPREASLALARAAGFPAAGLIPAWPDADLAAEVQLIRRTGVQAVVTKESGESGFLSIKIAAALHAGVPIFIVRRPDLPAHFHPIRSEVELLDFLRTCTHGLTAGS